MRGKKHAGDSTILKLLAALTLLVSAAAAEPRPRVTTDARMDLMGLIGALSDAPEVPDNPMTRAAVARFSRYRAHPAVLGAAAMRARSGARGLLMQYAVYLSSPPELSETAPAPVYFASAFGGRAELAAWRRDLAAFARDSGFLAWEEKTRGEREKLAADVRSAQGGRDLDAPLRRFLGARTWGDWVVYVSPFYAPGGSDSWILEEKPGRPQVVVLYGPYWNGRAFGPGRPEEFAEAAWPEAVFTMTYALSEACRPAYKVPRTACDGLRGLVNIEDCVQHYWVREIVARLTGETYGAAAERAYRESESDPLDAAARSAMDAYAGARTRYRDLVDAAAPLYAPFSPAETGARCLTDDPARFNERPYARRMAYYLEARLEAGPDEKAEAALKALR